MSDKLIYITDAEFDAKILNSDKPVLVDFWAEWCGPCKMLGPVFEKLANQFGDQVLFAKMDVEQNPNTPEKYEIQGIPTILVFEKGELKTRLIGARPEGELVTLIQGLIDVEPQKQAA